MEKRLAEIEARLAEITSEVSGIEQEKAPAEERAELQAKFDALTKETEALQEERKNLQFEIEKCAELNKHKVVIRKDDKEMENMEYREAFKEFVVKGTAIPMELRSPQQSTTSNAGAAIPTHLVQQIMAKLENYGNIYNRVTKTFYKGGVSLPFAGALPTASWVAERSGTDTAAISVTGITFAYHKLRVSVACSLEIANLTIDAFEAFVVNAIAKSMAKALDTAIVAGTGSSNHQPVGFATVTPTSGQALDATPTYANLCLAEGALPSGYDNSAVWVMNKKTFWQFMALVDDNGQPIARVNHGINGKPEYYLMGREVVMTDALDAYASDMTDDKVWACLVDLNRYILNMSYGMVIKEYEDNTTDDMVKKAIALVDGKFPDANAIVTLKK